MSWSEILPGIDEDAADLLSKLLEINPSKRIRIGEAMKHPFLKIVYRKHDCERKAEAFDMSFEHDKRVKTIFGVRHLMFKEIERFAKTRYKKLKEKSSDYRPKLCRLLFAFFCCMVGCASCEFVFVLALL